MKLFQEYSQRINVRFINTVMKQINEMFPIESENRRLELVDIEDISIPDINNVEEFSRLKLENGTWQMRVRVRLRLVDKKTGKTIDEKSVTLFNIPVAGPHGTFLYKGTEYVIPIQLRLKAGSYYKTKDDGTIEARVNLEQGENFKVVLDPQKGQLRLIQGGRSIKLIPFLRALGVTDDQMARAWGREQFEFLKSSDDGDPSKAVQTFMQVAFSKRYSHLWEDLDLSKPAEAVRVYLSRTVMDPEVNNITLGTAFRSSGPEHLLTLVKKLLDVARGEQEEMPPDSLVFKKAHAPWHFLEDILKQIVALSKTTIAGRLERYDDIRQIVTSNYFQKPIDMFFAQSSIVQAVMSPNPISILQSIRKVTYTGEGGIESDYAITVEQRSVDPYHMGFLDPVHTPEGEKIGANLYLSRGSTPTNDGELVANFFDVKKGQFVRLRPIDLFDKYVAFPEEGKIEGKVVRWKNPNAVRVIYKGRITSVPASKVDFILPTSDDMFDITSNLLPFLDSLQGNRAMMASKHLLQVISLKDREAPLVQIQAPDGKTYEQKTGEALAVVSPVDGVVEEVMETAIKIRDDSGKVHTVQIYDHLPLLGGHHLTHVPKVKKGDRVRKGQLLADNNFTKDGVLATGTNLVVAYMPWKGYNYEDGIVITESAAKKLASEHTYVIEKKIYDNVTVGKEQFLTLMPGVYTPEQLQKIGDDGVVREGEELQPGDPVILAISRLVKDEWRELNPALQALPDVRDDSVVWDKTVPGKVKKVVKVGDTIRVIVTTVEPAKVGDKLAGRHGNKGTISLIIPDSEAPRTPDGKVVDVILNPIGVPSRLNPSQLLETALGKVALKTGKPIAVRNFSDTDNVELVQKLLKQHGLKEKEKLYIPGEGETENEVFWGVQYINKLEQQVDKKTNIREEWGYDIDLQPLRGGQEGGGARAIDPLTLYSLIAHNVKDILKEMATYKAEKNDEFWLAIELNRVPPAPKPTFAFDKFVSYLKAAGINVEKKGDELIAKPMSDEDVLKMAPNEITDAGFIKAHDLSPEKGGLFDPNIFGGINGTKWAHVKLAVPVLNPVYEDIVRNLLGLSKAEMEELLSGKKGVDEDGNIVSADKAKYFAGEAFRVLLSKIDPDKKIKEIQQLIEKDSDPDNVAKYVRQLRVLRAIKNRDIDPKNFVMSVVPVLPPAFRPVYPSQEGNFFIVSPVNFRYRDLILVNKALKENLAKGTISEDDLKKEYAKMLYDKLKDLTVVGSKPYDEGKGLLPYLAGEGSPKGGFIHSKLFKRRQELSSTLVIENGPELGLDEVGLPEEVAWNLYKPFVIRRLTAQGYDLKKAKELVENKDPVAQTALEQEIKERPVLINRAPSLHKYSIMAFKPVLVKGKALKLSPLVTAGFNADFDGDTMGVHVPATEEAKREALKMLPSQNLFKPATQDKLMFNLRLEYIAALFLLSQPAPEGAQPKRSFKSYDELYEAWVNRRVKYNEVVRLDRFVGTVGQHLLNGLLPIQFKDYSEPWNGKKITQTLAKLATMDKELYKKVLETWKEIGRLAMVRIPFTISLSDMRDPELKKYKPLLDQVEKIPDEKERIQRMNEIVKIVTEKLAERAKQLYKENGLYTMFASGAKGSASQVRQLTFAPVMVSDHRGRPVPVPIKNDYGHGLTPAEYFAASFGARLGMLSKKLGVAEPGVINKELLNTIADQVVTLPDDPDDPGTPMKPEDEGILDRVLAQDVKKNGKVLAKAGDVVTPKLRDMFIKEKVDVVYVKSPITATTAEGLPATAVGKTYAGQMPQIGENVGVHAGQALTEPLSQATFNFFHTGGVAEAKHTMQILDIVKYLMRMPKNPDARAAVLATVAGKVEKIEKLPTGATKIVIDGKEHLVPPGKDIKVKEGDKVYKGQPLTDGVIHPLQMAQLRSVYDAQKALADQLYEAAKANGINITKPAAEIIARGVMSTAAVVAPGDAPLPPGQFVSVQALDNLNKQMSEVVEMEVDKAIGYRLAEPVKHIFAHTRIDKDIAKELKDLGVKKVKVYKEAVKYVPVVRGTTTQTLYREDWLHKATFSRIKQSLPWAAASGERTKLTGISPLSRWLYGATFGQFNPQPKLNLGRTNK